MAIYLIEMEGLNLLKIGFTERDPYDRLRELQTANPHKLNLLLVQSGGLKQESALHAMFSHLREQGEWFRFTPELQCYLTVAKFVFPRLNELEERIEHLRKLVDGSSSDGSATPWTLDIFSDTVHFNDRISDLSEHVGRLIEKVENGNPDSPPAWQGEIDDLRGLVHAMINSDRTGM